MLASLSTESTSNPARPYWTSKSITLPWETWASGATLSMLNYAMETFPLRRIDAWVYAWNPASARVLEKCGFVHEGTARRNAIKDGHILDEWLYGYAPEE